eukprot:gene2891-3152_t
MRVNVWVCLIIACLINASFASEDVYSWSLALQHSDRFEWNEVRVTVLNESRHKELLPVQDQNHIKASSFMSTPVYVSITTVSYRIHRLHDAVRTILDGLVQPDHIFVFMSEEPFLYDRGIQSIPDPLLALAVDRNISLVFTDNLGPHRKLLPLLHRFFLEDVLIITVDDDMTYRKNSTLVYHLIEGFVHTHGGAVVALRARRIGFCDTFPHTLLRYTYWSIPYPHQTLVEMLVVPTGTGGVLYRPRFFSAVVFDNEFRNLTSKADDIAFRLACMINHVPVAIACRDLEDTQGIILRKCPINYGLWNNQKMHFQNFSLLSESGKNKSTIIMLNEYNRRLKQTLYRQNKKGGNEQQWNQAVQYLQEKGLLDFQSMMNRYYTERERECYESRPHLPAENKRAPWKNHGKLHMNNLCSIRSCEEQHGEVIRTTFT